MNKEKMGLVARFSGRHGGIMILTAAISVFLLTIVALVTDVGYLYSNHSKLQIAVNAGWKAGYDRMKGLQKSGVILDAKQKADVKAQVLEIMKMNGLTDAELAAVKVTFLDNNGLRVQAQKNVGMFFAKFLDIDSANVAAMRQNQDGGASIIPLVIPHGVTKDFSKNVYSCDMFQGEDGFASGTEYILKLGSGGGNAETPIDKDELILVPMDSGSQTSNGFLKAYGAAFWCLRIGDGTDTGFVPVYWLLGYRGGAFFLPSHADVEKKLKDLKVNYVKITGKVNIQAIFSQVNPNVLELYDRPRIAVYSSQDGTDPVEDVLLAANIPYGNYSLPSGWKRYDNYRADSNGHIYDAEILDNVLDDYHWVHLHHEDFTGFNGGCSYYLDSCRDSFDANRIGTEANAQRRMCSYCSSKYTLETSGYYDRRGRWISTTAWVWSGSYNRSQCKHINTRCAERKGHINNTLWRNDAGVTMCGSSDYPQCREYGRLVDIATAYGYSSDANSEPKPQTPVSTGNNGPGIAANQDGWFNRANKVQKMKFDVVRKIRNHVEVGGFLFAQCFAPETLDIALWQAEIHDGASPLNAYSACFAFTDYVYRRFPIKYGVSYYSTINEPVAAGTAMPFDLLNPFDPRCQNHGTWPDTGSGHTASFRHACIKDDCSVLGNRRNYSTQAKYLRGKRGDGEFTFLGGHYHHNVESKRLVLNNILLGSLVEKDVTGEVAPPAIVGKSKNNYGVVDPDNSNSGGANDYRDRFMFGANIPVDINDRLMGESGNMVGPTDQAVEFRILGSEEFAPNRRVIVPITDIGPEIAENNPKNALASTVYDLQGQDHPNGFYRPENYDFGSSVRIIGFAEFEILSPAEYTRDEKDGLVYESGDAGDLGPYQPGQVRGRFIRYIIHPKNVKELLY